MEHKAGVTFAQVKTLDLRQPAVTWGVTGNVADEVRVAIRCVATIEVGGVTYRIPKAKIQIVGQLEAYEGTADELGFSAEDAERRGEGEPVITVTLTAREALALEESLLEAEGEFGPPQGRDVGSARAKLARARTAKSELDVETIGIGDVVYCAEDDGCWIDGLRVSRIYDPFGHLPPQRLESAGSPPPDHRRVECEGSAPGHSHKLTSITTRRDARPREASLLGNTVRIVRETES
jgi:hypothetical protein